MNELEEISVKVGLILPEKLDAFTSELLYGVVIYNQDGEIMDPTKISIDLEEGSYESI